MEKQIKKTFLLLAASILFITILLCFAQFTPAPMQSNANIILTNVILMFLLALSFIFFIASYISNLVKFRKEKNLREYLVFLTLSVFLVLLIFLPEFLHIHIARMYALIYVAIFQFLVFYYIYRIYKSEK